MVEYIEKEVLLGAIDCEFFKTYPDGAEQIGVLKCRRIAHTLPAADVVSRATFEQVMWERDVAIQQLKDLGVGFGEKADVAPIVRCKECIHRESCQKQIVLWERDHVLEQNIYRYHKLGFCSYGVRRSE